MTATTTATASTGTGSAAVRVPVGSPGSRRAADRATLIAAGIEALSPTVAALLTDRIGREVALDPAWATTFRALPRHRFVPACYLRTDHLRTDPDGFGDKVSSGDDTWLRWLDAVSADTPLITGWETVPAGPGRVPAPVVTGSATQPSVLAELLRLAELVPGHRVLEIGTGSGYLTALLTGRVGEGRVTSIDIVAELVDAARDRLSALASHPRLEVGSGFAPPGDPGSYDRLVCTCSVARIPQSWFELLAPGGMVVAPLSIAGGLVVLTKHRDGTLSGPVQPRPVSFGPMRLPGHRVRAPATPPLPELPARLSGDDRLHDVTDLDPNLLDDPDFAFFAAMARPDLLISARSAGAARRESALVHTAHARASVLPGPGDRWLTFRSSSSLWGQVEDAYRFWTTAGRPGRGAVELVASPGGSQYFALADDDPGRRRRFGLPDFDHPSPTPWPLSNRHLDGGWAAS